MQLLPIQTTEEERPAAAVIATDAATGTTRPTAAVVVAVPFTDNDSSGINAAALETSSGSTTSAGSGGSDDRSVRNSGDGRALETLNVSNAPPSPLFLTLRRNPAWYKNHLLELAKQFGKEKGVRLSRKATRSIKAGGFVARYAPPNAPIIHDPAELQRQLDLGNVYMMRVGNIEPPRWIDGWDTEDRQHLGRFVNHRCACAANCKFLVDSPNSIVLVAIDEIMPGDWLSVDYGYT